MRTLYMLLALGALVATVEFEREPISTGFVTFGIWIILCLANAARDQITSWFRKHLSVLLWTGVFLSASAILVLATLPERQIYAGVGGGEKIFDFSLWKVGHVCAFAVFAGLLALAQSATKRLWYPNFWVMTKTAAASLTLSILKEGAQFLSPGRFPRLSDVGLDISGICLGTICAFALCVVVARHVSRT